MEEKIGENIGETIDFAKEVIEERKKKIIKFLKEKKDWIYYLILSFLIFIGVYLRSLNIPKLKDITTGTWTLGPDLDPFLFLRWAQYIVEHGSLMVLDTMRNVPLGFNTTYEMKLLSYMIAWFYHFLAIFSKEVTVTYAANLFPVVAFALTAIAFFLFARKIFYKKSQLIKNSIALIATAFFVLVPSFLPRTIAGIPEKESIAFFFMFMAFYLFIEAFTSEKFKRALIFGILAGVSTALMSLIWGGMILVFFTIPTAVLLSFIFGKIKKKEFFIYTSWLITSFVLMVPFSTRYNIQNLITSTSTGLAIGVFGIIGISLILVKIKKLEILRKKIKLPKELFYLICSILILMVLVLIVLGPMFIHNQIFGTLNSLIRPMVTRFGLTVAENKQPYFIGDWTGNFGPISFNIPLFFWMFILGSVMLFNNLIVKLGKAERIKFTMIYFLFLIGLIFSRYSPSSILNGTSFLSLVIYFGSWLLFLGYFGKIYYKKYKEEKLEVFKEFDFSYILYFILLTIGVIGARSAIRLIMVLGVIGPVAIGFLIVKASQNYLRKKGEMKIIIGLFLLVLIIASLFTLGTYYQQNKYAAENFAPSGYQFQWQNAMSWIRENTPTTAVFAHWWDYGYWVQSIGERATILDGGNAIIYWNHLMGRHVLTGTDERKALEFLYPHEGTHLLIDSTDIGKYTAYSSIGSDEDYDRFSWISTFLMDQSQTLETSNEVTYFYRGGTVADEDFVWKQDEREIFLPKRSTKIGAIIVKKNDQEIFQPLGIFLYNGQQYNIPLRYAYVEDKFYDFKTGIEYGVFFFPEVTQKEGMINSNPIGALLLFSKKTVYSNMVNLFLFEKDSEYFNLVHKEDNLIVKSLKEQGMEIGDFIYYHGLHGPIKIWEINYPEDIKKNESYLEIDFPDQRLNLAKIGEY